MKTLEEFDSTQAPQIPAANIRELAEGGDRRMWNGKSHWQRDSVWLLAGRTCVRFTTAAALVNELGAAKQMWARSSCFRWYRKGLKGRR